MIFFKKVKRLFSRKPRIGLALAGGGCKAFFGLGVGAVLLENGVPIRALAGTSAGSAMVMSLAGNSIQSVVDHYYAITLRNPSNFHFSKLLKGKYPWPHERMYRRALRTYIDLDAIQKSSFDIAITTVRLPPDIYPPENSWKRTRLMGKLAAIFRQDISNINKGVYQPILTQFADDMNLEEVVFNKKDFTSEEELENIVLASSSVPPLVSFQRMSDGNYYLDGGLYNNLPLNHLPGCNLLIGVYYEEWTRTQADILKSAGDKRVLYVKPDKALPITTWDYANPEGVLEAYRMGREAGERTLDKLEKFF